MKEFFTYWRPETVANFVSECELGDNLRSCESIMGERDQANVQTLVPTLNRLIVLANTARGLWNELEMLLWPEGTGETAVTLYWSSVRKTQGTTGKVPIGKDVGETELVMVGRSVEIEKLPRAQLSLTIIHAI